MVVVVVVGANRYIKSGMVLVGVWASPAPPYKKKGHRGSICAAPDCRLRDNDLLGGSALALLLRCAVHAARPFPASAVQQGGASQRGAPWRGAG